MRKYHWYPPPDMKNVKNFTQIGFWTAKFCVKLRKSWQILQKKVHKSWPILWEKVCKSQQNQILQKKVCKLWQILWNKVRKSRHNQILWKKVYKLRLILWKKACIPRENWWLPPLFDCAIFERSLTQKSNFFYMFFFGFDSRSPEDCWKKSFLKWL